MAKPVWGLGQAEQKRQRAVDHIFKHKILGKIA
jgi:hypothetical protein